MLENLAGSPESIGWIALASLAVLIAGLIILAIALRILRASAPSAQARRESGISLPSQAQQTPEGVYNAQQTHNAADGGTIAAITAAVAVIMQAQGKNGGFIVRSVKRIDNTPAWRR